MAALRSTTSRLMERMEYHRKIYIPEIRVLLHPGLGLLLPRHLSRRLQVYRLALPHHFRRCPPRQCLEKGYTNDPTARK